MGMSSIFIKCEKAIPAIWCVRTPYHCGIEDCRRPAPARALRPRTLPRCIADGVIRSLSHRHSAASVNWILLMHPRGCKACSARCSSHSYSRPAEVKGEKLLLCPAFGGCFDGRHSALKRRKKAMRLVMCNTRKIRENGSSPVHASTDYASRVPSRAAWSAGKTDQ